MNANMVSPAFPRWALLALALAVVGPAALASAEDGDAEGQAWGDEPRNVAAWPEGGGFAVRSMRESSLGQDEIDATYDSATAELSVTLDVQEPQDSDVVAVLGLGALTEFRDVDGDGRLGPADEVVRRVPIAGTPAVGAIEALADGGWRATSTHSLPTATSSSGIATPRLEFVVEVRSAVDDGKQPTRLDVSARVLDGWTRNGTHLALETTLDGDEAPRDVGADAASVDEDGLELALTWQDGRGTAVEGSDPASVDFVRSQPASHLVEFPVVMSASWHPVTDAKHAPGGNVLLYVGAALVAVAALALPAWRRLHG